MAMYHNMILKYFLAGLVMCFLLELVVRKTGDFFTKTDRFFVITLWPIAILVFVYYFIKGMLE
jgi:hypothetical protein